MALRSPEETKEDEVGRGERKDTFFCSKLGKQKRGGKLVGDPQRGIYFA